NDETNKLLVSIIDRIIIYKLPNGEKVDNFRTDWMIIKILFSLSLELIKDVHINYLRESLNSKWNSSLIESELLKNIFPNVLKYYDKNLVLKILDIILDIKDKETEAKKYEPIVNNYYLNNILKKFNHDIAKTCGKQAVIIAA